MEEDFDPYRVLGLPVGAEEAAIRRRYRALVRKHHPDVSADAEKAHDRFVRIQRAYQVLMDPEQRASWERRAGSVGGDGSQVTVARPATRVEQLLLEGRLLLRRRNLRAAHSAVAEAIELNPFDAEAYRLLGDIYLAGGKNQLAFEMYEEAKRLGGRPVAHRESPRDPIPTESEPSAPERARLRVPVLATGLVGAGVCLAAMLLTDFASQPLLFSAWGSGAGFLLAAGGAASGVLEPVDELFGLASVAEPGRGAAPGGVYLLVLSLVSPYLGVVYYALSSILTETQARGMVKVYAATFALSFCGWLTAHGAAAHLFPMVAPSVAFAALFAGWLAGSFAAPGEWWRR